MEKHEEVVTMSLKFYIILITETSVLKSGHCAWSI